MKDKDVYDPIQYKEEDVVEHRTRLHPPVSKRIRLIRPTVIITPREKRFLLKGYPVTFDVIVPLRLAKCQNLVDLMSEGHLNFYVITLRKE